MKNILYFFLFLIANYSFGQKPIFTAAKVKSATVYFNAAEISETTSVFLPAGSSEIVIKNVADYLNENTIQVAAPKTVTVLSVQFTNNYISEYEIDEKSPLIKKVRDSIRLVEKEILKTTNQKNSENKAIELLDKNQQVFGINSGLSVAELTKMVDYYKLKRTEISNSSDALAEKIFNLNELLTNLNNKLEINTNNEEKISKGKLILQVMNEVAGMVVLDLNYLTSNASWNPFYDLRANSVSEPIEMMYKAKVFQNTGIDWKKVKLTLSSGNPNQNNQSPELNPWFLRYKQPISNDGYLTNFDKILQGRVAGLAVESESGAPGATAKVRIRGTSSLNLEAAEPLYIINGVPSSSDQYANLPPETIKSVSVLKDASAISIYGSRGANGVLVITTKQGMDDYTNISENQLNISFDIDVPYDILSNGKVHSVALKEIELPATYKYFAAPKADNDAFLLAEISNYAQFNLLPGEANIIFEGLYVGKTKINPGQTSDTLNLSMGRDKKIIIKREKVADKSGTKFLSSKTEQTFTYDIVIRNNKKEAIAMTLKDQYPLSSDKEIEVELLQSDNAKISAETGMLTWNLNLKPNETKKIRISYKIKSPKGKAIDNL